jgi:hypothetical protein
MADEIPAFTRNHWDRVYSIAWIAYVDCDNDLPHDGESLKGPVIINGKRYTCTGVEVSNKIDGPIGTGDIIGLLIEGQI